MVTLYQLLGVEENADKESIKKAYDVRINHPALDEKKKNKVRMAAEILLNDEKREKYNKDLADYRAQELLKSVTFSNSSNDTVDVTIEENAEEIVEKEESSIQKGNENEVELEIDNQTKIDNINDESVKKESSVMKELSDDIFSALEENKEHNEKLTEEEKIAEENERLRLENEERKRQELRKIEEDVNKKEYEKILKKQEALDKKQRKKAEKEYKEKYQQAYVDELRNRGYNVKYPWTWKRVKNLLITLVVTIVVIVVLWQLPFVREPLVELYNENQIIKTVVDIFASLIKAIFSIFESK